MPETPGFHLESELALSRRFLADGSITMPVEDAAGLERIRALTVATVTQHTNCPVREPADLLNGIHEHVDIAGLNALRLAVINAFRTAEWFRPALYSLARSALSTLVGNELAMQRGVGLSVQLPDDTSSLLPVHTDVWDGDSPFEVVLWVPLVDCAGTKSMFIVRPDDDRRLQADMHELQDASVEDLYRRIEPSAEHLEVPFGSALLFSQTLMHGNRVNQSNETRWSINCRFKSILSPYADKKLGEFFEPITLRPATSMGMNYKLPDGFHE